MFVLKRGAPREVSKHGFPSYLHVPASGSLLDTLVSQRAGLEHEDLGFQGKENKEIGGKRKLREEKRKHLN